MGQGVYQGDLFPRKKGGQVMPGSCEKINKVDTASGAKMAYGGLVIQGDQALAWKEAMGASLVFQARPKSPR